MIRCFIALVLFITSSLLFAQTVKSRDECKPLELQTNDSYFTFAPNNISIVLSNNGSKAHDPVTGGPGLEWPAGSGKYVGFQMGTIWGGVIGSVLQIGGSTYLSSLQAGTILNDGTAADPNDKRYRIYHVEKDLTNSEDYVFWPKEDGAPVDEFGKPLLFGDQQVWYVMNDLDRGRANRFYNTLPIGIEFQITSWGSRTAILDDVVFFREKIINKSNSMVEYFHAGFFLDFDISDGLMDLGVVDTALGIVYTYKATSRDSIYGVPPAVGVVMLQPARVHAHVVRTPGQATHWRYDLILYNNLSGLLDNATPIINPLTGTTTRFMYSGDPMTGKGWLMEQGNDIRGIVGFAPTTFKPNDTLTLEYAIIVGQVLDNIQSVKKVQYIAKYIRTMYGLTSTTSVNEVPNLPASPHLHAPYPNPVQNPGTAVTIDFSIPDDDQVLLELTDAFGRRVVSIVERQVQRGTHSIAYKPDEALSSGVYHLVLRSNNRLNRQPLIIHR